jgi:23S rRNA (guanosine2251-2'-O)-methyltransferase
MSREEAVLYGIHPVLETLRSGLPVSKIYLALHRDDSAGGEIFALARQRKISLLMVHKEELNRIAGTTKHQGVVAWVPPKSDHDLDSLLSISSERAEPPFFLLVDSVEDPRNLGAILRTAESAGVHGVIIPKRRAAGLSPVVSKTSAGATAHLPLARVTNLSQTIDQLKKELVWVVGLDASASASYLECDFQKPVAIIVGGEEAGIHQKILERCDEIVSLPMRGIVESLNVSVAAGIVIYEALRQREKERKKK